jgi:site-specific DNA-methyltransferase (adenine-specific)
MGSGSSRVAAFEENRDYVGFEINEEYFNNQQARFTNHTKQLKLIA